MAEESERRVTRGRPRRVSGLLQTLARSSRRARPKHSHPPHAHSRRRSHGRCQRIRPLQGLTSVALVPLPRSVKVGSLALLNPDTQTAVWPFPANSDTFTQEVAHVFINRST